jgi:hypothetical protein
MGHLKGWPEHNIALGERLQRSGNGRYTDYGKPMPNKRRCAIGTPYENPTLSNVIGNSRMRLPVA